jgi:hypothetical protein
MRRSVCCGIVLASVIALPSGTVVGVVMAFRRWSVVFEDQGTCGIVFIPR